MEEHIHLFNTVSEFNAAYNSSAYTEPWAGYVIEDKSSSYNKHDYSKDYLTFKIISNGVIRWANSANWGAASIDYKLNDGEWTTIVSNSGSSAPTINVVAGDKIQFRGNNNQYSNGTYINNFNGSTAVFNVEGNIMSLIDSTGFTTATTFDIRVAGSTHNFYCLFYQCTGLTSAENLILPATTLTRECYYGMFRGCTSLTTAPELPATTLANNCYWFMFNSCTSLTTAPELPATTLATQCYYFMFSNCTSLTTAPELPATTLANSCYYGMFNGCSSLNYIKCLATNISASNCTTNWVNGVASSGTFVKNPNMSSWTTGVNGIPTNWAVQDAQ